MNTNTNNFLISTEANRVYGDIIIPGDKSISHRSLIFAGLANGKTEISGLLESDDVLNTKKAMQSFGVTIVKESEKYIVFGQGLNSLKEPVEALDLGNSGTGCRLLMGVAAPQKFTTEFVGDESLSSRPMMRVIKPLSEMGVEVSCRDGGLLPVKVTGTDLIKPITYELPVASAQVKSAVLLAGLSIKGETTVIENTKTRDHTERMMEYLGVDVKVTENGDNGSVIKINGGNEFDARDVSVAADPSSAAFPVVACLITPNSKLTVRNVLTNPSRFGLFETLLEMGADITIENRRTLCGEEVADITARTSKLKGITIPASRAPSMIDEYPIVSIAASYAEGTTYMEGLEELKVKESDRLQAIYDGLKACNVAAEMGEDSLSVTGGKFEGGGTISTHGDHRISMSFLVAGLASEKPIKTDKPEMIATSFPGFMELMNSIGAQINYLS